MYCGAYLEREMEYIVCVYNGVSEIVDTDFRYGEGKRESVYGLCV